MQRRAVAILNVDSGTGHVVLASIVLNEGAVGEAVDTLPGLAVMHDVRGRHGEDPGDVGVFNWTLTDGRPGDRPDAVGSRESASSRISERMEECFSLRVGRGQALNCPSEDSSVFAVEQLE